VSDGLYFNGQSNGFLDAIEVKSTGNRVLMRTKNELIF